MKTIEEAEELIVGKYYYVPCVHVGFKKLELQKTTRKLMYDDQVGYFASEGEPAIYQDIALYTPIINHLHNDKENGQPEPHYHVDYRFEFTNDMIVDGSRIFLKDLQSKEIVYKSLKLLTTTQKNITHVDFIAKSKLKHKCIHKNKCPHRGYDLSKEQPIYGVITCPLHGLRFDAVTKKLVD